MAKSYVYFNFLNKDCNDCRQSVGSHFAIMMKESVVAVTGTVNSIFSDNGLKQY